MSNAVAEEAEKKAPPDRDISFDGPYEPLTNRQKFARFVDHTTSVYTFTSAATNATWLQMNGEPYSYGGGMDGWMRRFGFNIIGTETRSFFSQFLFPTVLNQDPRYFPMRKGNIFKRGWYAGTRVLVVRSDNGSQTFNTSFLLSVAASNAVSTLYAPPDRQNFQSVLIRTVGAYGSDATNSVIEEFLPDVLAFLRRHAPKSILKIEKKIPPQILGTSGAEQEKKSDDATETPTETPQNTPLVEDPPTNSPQD